VLNQTSSAAGPHVRRKRDPDSTRAAILEAASKLLGQDGPEGLSVSQVAQFAGVNRGTAYQHFQTREQLLEATTAYVSEKLRHAVFGDQDAEIADIRAIDPRVVAERLAEFAFEHPEAGRVWLFELLGSERPSSDPFWNQYKTQFERFAASDLAQPGIDCEVHSLMLLIGVFLWPVFGGVEGRSAERYANEILRLCLHGTMRPEKFPEPVARLGKSLSGGTGAK
jgi:AcrR family transcriptional regulator